MPRGSHCLARQVRSSIVNMRKGRAMAALKGSKTEDNLKAAFAG